MLDPRLLATVSLTFAYVLADLSSLRAHHLRHVLVTYRLLQVALHYYQPVSRAVLRLLKQGEAGLHGYGECLF
jgi:hypothetical protein